MQALAIAALAISNATGQVTSVDPFVGELFEGFETQHTQVGGSHPAGGAPCVLGDIFGGQATLCSLDAPFIISLNGGSNANCTINHRTGSYQGASLFRPFQINFLNDQQVFGGYFGSDNLSPGDSNFVTVEFLDRQGVSLGIVQEVLYVGCGQYTWFGWRAPGIASVRFHSVTNGMSTYMDDLFASPMEPLGELACVPTENSLEERAYCAARGSALVADNQLTLHASMLPADTFGFFLCSQATGNTPFPGGSEGILCLGGSIGRFNGLSQILFSGSARSYSLPVDLLSMPQPSGPVAVQAGETWYFQSWFRDFDSTPQMNSTSNFTSSLAIQFQ